MRLRSKLMLYFIVLMFAGIVCSGYITYKNVYKNIVNKAEEVMAVTTDAVRNSKIQIIDNIETSLYIIADLDMIKNLTDNPNPTAAERERVSDFFSNNLRNLFGATSLTLLNSQGVSIASSLESSIGVDFSDRDYIHEVLDHGRVISGPYHSKLRDIKILAVAVLVTSDSGTGSILVASLDMLTLAKFTLGNIHVRKDEKIFIAGKNGEVMYALDKTIPQTINIDESLLGDSGKIDIEINGIKMLAVYEYVDGDWYAFTAIPNYVIAKEAESIRNQLISVSFLVVLIVILVLFFSVGHVIDSMQTALEKESSLLKTMINSIPDFFFVKDLNGLYQSCNSAFKNSLGKSDKDIIGKTDAEVFKDEPEAAEQLFSNCNRALMTNSLCVHEGWLKYSDHSSHLLETILTPFGTSDGQIQGILGISRDVTLRYNQEKVIEKTKTDALEAAKTKAEFLARMSHEIRTPLNGIIGMNSLALTTTDDPRLKNYLTKVSSSADNLLTIVNDILDFSKIEAGKMNVERTPFNLLDTINYIKDIVQTKVAEKKLEFTCEVADNVPAVLVGDPLRVSQVLLNLLSNAVKFTEKGGVRLSVSAESNIDSQTDLRFDITDTGIGMTDEQLSRLFKSFSQADGSISRKYGGTGLGLTIAKLLAELMGGRIEVQSRIYEGSTFSFFIRFALTEEKSHENKTQPATQEQLSSLVSKRVLLVEDNKINQEIATALLSALKMETDVVSDGLEAIEAACSKEYDIILMDIQMPNMDGYEATKYLKSKGLTIPIIAMTANVMNEDKEKAYKAGMDDHLGKPFKFDEFRNTLIKWLVVK